MPLALPNPATPEVTKSPGAVAARAARRRLAGRPQGRHAGGAGRRGGVDPEGAEALVREGRRGRLMGPRIGPVKAADGTCSMPTCRWRTSPASCSTRWCCPTAPRRRQPRWRRTATPLEFIKDQFRHCKTILVLGAGQRHQRRVHPGFNDEEDRHQHRGNAQQTQRLAREPAGFVAVDDAVHRQHQRGGDGDGAPHIELGAAGLPLAAGQQHHAQRKHRGAYGQVDQEDPVPVQRIGQHAAQQHADAAATGADKAVDTHGLGALGRLGEKIHDERERNRRHHRAAQALHGARHDQQHLRIGQAAGQRGHRKEREPRQEEPAVAIQIAQPPAQQQEAAEGQHVGVDHPDQRGLGKGQVGADGRQGHVHDGGVEHDHQHARGTSTVRAHQRLRLSMVFCHLRLLLCL
jgi:hypothetical protein